MLGEIEMKERWRHWWEEYADPETFLQEQLPRTENVRPVIYSIMKNVVRRRGSILDVGCGPAVDYEAIKDMGFEWTGIDFTPQFIEYVKTKYGGGANIKLMNAYKRLKFKDKKFNLTYAKDLFEHLPPDKWQKVVKGMWRVTKDYMLLAFFKPPDGEPTDYHIVTKEENSETYGVYSNHYNKDEWIEYIRGKLRGVEAISIKESIIYRKRWDRPKGYSIWLVKRRQKDEED